MLSTGSVFFLFVKVTGLRGWFLVALGAYVDGLELLLGPVWAVLGAVGAYVGSLGLS